MANNRRHFIWTFASCVAVGRAQTYEKNDIFQAAAAGDNARCTELLKADPDLVRSRSISGNTPIHFAATAGKADMVMFLLTKGAELSAGSESPLIPAVDFPEHSTAIEMSEALLANGSNPNVARADGTTAVQLAVRRNNTEVVQKLIHRGAGAPAGLSEGIERIYPARRFIQDRHEAAITRDDTYGLPWVTVNKFVTLAHFDFDQVKQLKKETPLLVNTRSSWDELAIEAASHMGRFEMADWLANQGAAVSTCTAALLGETSLVKKALVADPACVHERGAHDIPILAYTVFSDERTEVAEHLLSAGANSSARALGATLLHLAARKGYVNVASLLIAGGADVNATAPSKDGPKTALDVATAASQTRMVRLLRDHGAKVP